MTFSPRILVGIPVFNEAEYVVDVINEIHQFAPNILVVDDGSTDETPQLLSSLPVQIVRHPRNRGYGRATRKMLEWAAGDQFDWLITIDCDRQHVPSAIPGFVSQIQENNADVISGSRYLNPHRGDDVPPAERLAINQQITAELNSRLKTELTDAFCGFKAYRIRSCAALQLDVDGYDFPMQFWVQAVAAGLVIKERAVQLIYHDPSRTFGGELDDHDRRLREYRLTLHEEIIRCSDRLPEGSARGLGLDEPSRHE